MHALVRAKSKWEFVTSSTGGFGVEFVAVEGGSIYLTDPAGAQQTFRYGAAGGGVAWGLKLPKLGKIELKVKGKGVGGAVAPSAFPNAGVLYIMDSFKGNELSRSDITGACVFVEAYGGLIAGYSGTAMLVGVNPVWLAALITMPLAPVPAMVGLVQSARGLLLMRGFNAGIVGGIGAGAFVGGLF